MVKKAVFFGKKTGKIHFCIPFTGTFKGGGKKPCNTPLPVLNVHNASWSATLAEHMGPETAKNGTILACMVFQRAKSVEFTTSYLKVVGCACPMPHNRQYTVGALTTTSDNQ
jgi:hypothetical protein